MVIRQYESSNVFFDSKVAYNVLSSRTSFLTLSQMKCDFEASKRSLLSFFDFPRLCFTILSLSCLVSLARSLFLLFRISQLFSSASLFMSAVPSYRRPSGMNLELERTQLRIHVLNEEKFLLIWI